MELHTFATYRSTLGLPSLRSKLADIVTSFLLPANAYYRHVFVILKMKFWNSRNIRISGQTAWYSSWALCYLAYHLNSVLQDSKNTMQDWAPIREYQAEERKGIYHPHVVSSIHFPHCSPFIAFSWILNTVHFQITATLYSLRYIRPELEFLMLNGLIASQSDVYFPSDYEKGQKHTARE